MHRFALLTNVKILENRWIILFKAQNSKLDWCNHLGNVHKWRPTIFYDFRPPYLPCPTTFNLFSIRFSGVILDPLPTLKLDVINWRLQGIAWIEQIRSKLFNPFPNAKETIISFWDLLSSRNSENCNNLIKGTSGHSLQSTLCNEAHSKESHFTPNLIFSG